MPGSDQRSTTSKILSCLTPVASYVFRPQTWVLINFLGDVLTAFVNNILSVAQNYDSEADLFISDDDNYLNTGLSSRAFMIGLILAPIFSGGAICCSYMQKVNSNYQSDNPEKFDMTAAEAKEDPANNPAWWQILAYACDFITHTGSNAGMPLYVLSVVIHSRAPWDKFTVQWIANAYSVICAIGNNIALDDIRLYNKIKLDKKATEKLNFLGSIESALKKHEDDPDALRQIEFAKQKLTLFASKLSHRDDLRPDTALYIPLSDDERKSPAPQ